MVRSQAVQQASTVVLIAAKRTSRNDVTLTTAASRSTFTGWSGACSGTGQCSVTMDADKTVTATFNQQVQQYTLTVTKAGTGSGTVTSNPAGINCGDDCSETYDQGTMSH